MRVQKSSSIFPYFSPAASFPRVFHLIFPSGSFHRIPGTINPVGFEHTDKRCFIPKGSHFTFCTEGCRHQARITAGFWFFLPRAAC